MNARMMFARAVAGAAMVLLTNCTWGASSAYWFPVSVCLTMLGDWNEEVTLLVDCWVFTPTQTTVALFYKILWV